MVQKTSKQKYKKNKSIKRKKQLVMGGFVEEPVIINLQLNSDLKVLLAPIYKAITPDKLIYISVGGKYTEENLERTLCYPTTKPCPTNSAYQMVPYFLCKNSPARQNMGHQNVVCIVIDIFNDNDDIHKSIDHIKKQGNDTSNVKMYIINLLNVQNQIMATHLYNPIPHAEYMKTLIQAIILKADEQNVDSKNIMVCNYVKFKHPNRNEHVLQDKMIENIKAAMNPKYTKSYYNWCGYDPMMYYNCITKSYNQNPLSGEHINDQMAIYSTDDFNDTSHKFEKMFVINKAKPLPLKYSNSDNNFVYSVKDIMNNIEYNFDNNLNLA